MALQLEAAVNVKHRFFYSENFSFWQSRLAPSCLSICSSSRVTESLKLYRLWRTESDYEVNCISSDMCKPRAARASSDLLTSGLLTVVWTLTKTGKRNTALFLSNKCRCTSTNISFQQLWLSLVMQTLNSALSVNLWRCLSDSSSLKLVSVRTDWLLLVCVCYRQSVLLPCKAETTAAQETQLYDKQKDPIRERVTELLYVTSIYEMFVRQMSPWWVPNHIKSIWKGFSLYILHRWQMLCLWKGTTNMKFLGYQQKDVIAEALLYCLI